MAKKISFGDMPLANNGLKLSKKISIAEIEKHPVFESIYTIDPDLKDRIAEDMINHGFDPSQPVHIWAYMEEDGTSHKYLIDGYTRLSAAEQAGITVIPYYEHKFESQDEAYMYALHLQVDRRNLTEQELLYNIEKLMGTDYVQSYKGRKADAIAEKLGISSRKVQQAMSVINDATEEQKEEIASGESTINKIYTENHPSPEKKKAKKPEATVISDEEDDDDGGSFDDFDDLSDSLSDPSGTPSPLGNFEHSDGYECPTYSPDDEDETDIWIKEKNLQVDESRKEGYSSGFYDALIFGLGEVKRGRTPDEVFADERVADLSPEIICKFVLPPEDEDAILPR